MDKADGRDRRGRLSAIVPNALRHLRHRCRTWHAMRTKAGRGSTSCSETVAEETPEHTRVVIVGKSCNKVAQSASTLRTFLCGQTGLANVGRPTEVVVDVQTIKFFPCAPPRSSVCFPSPRTPKRN
jgi:hypothetical protein